MTFFETKHKERFCNSDNLSTVGGNAEILCNDLQLNIFYQNLCGINNKRQELEVYLSALPDNFNYLCISEHFLNNKLVSLLNFTNYMVVSYNTRINKKRGGTLILGSKNVNCVELPIAKTLYKMDSFEICCVKDNETEICICSCYRTPDDKNFEDFMERLEKLLEYLFNKKCFICGDFNIDLLTDRRKKAEFMNLLTCFNFRPLIHDVTFIRNESRSCIDNILVNISEDKIINCNIDNNGLSDGHAGLLCKTAVPSYRKKPKNTRIRVIRRALTENNKSKFRQHLLKEHLNVMGLNTFIKKFYAVFQNSVPLRKKTIDINRKLGLQWITEGIKVSSQMKRFLSVGKGYSDNVSVDKYRNIYITLYRKVIRKAKKLLYKMK